MQKLRASQFRRYARLTRRSFVAQSLGAGAMLALEPSIQPRNTEVRTIFFNLSQQASRSPSYLSIAGQHHVLRQVSENPGLLTQARLTNNFLRQVPDREITHFVQDISLPSDLSTLGYVYTDPNTTTGTYSLNYLVQYVPRQALANAYQRSRVLVTEGPLPLSTKRSLYNATPAFTLQDLENEQELIDPSDFARTLIGLHPEFLAANVTAAAKVQYTYIAQAQYTRNLTNLLTSLGPAQPKGQNFRSDQPGWATLIPYMDANDQPARNSMRLNQYDTDWHPDIASAVVKAIFDINPRIKDDTTLGANLTGLKGDSTDPGLAGKLWFRHDGFSSFSAPVKTTLQIEREIPKVTFSSANSAPGVQFVNQPSAEMGGDGSLKVSLNTVRNWFLRFLSVYLQFKDNQGNVIDPGQLPADIVQNFPYAPGLVYSKAVFAGFLSPPPTVAGVPIAPADYAVTLNLPASVSSVGIFFGGIGNNAIPTGYIDNNWIIIGATLTGLVNYALVTLLMAAGALPDIAPVARFIFQLAVSEGVLPLVALTGSNVFDAGKVNITNLVVNITKGLINAGTVPVLARILALVTKQITVSQLLDNVPIVGNIARVAAAVIGAIQLVETSIEVGLSPRIYGFDIALTHPVKTTVYPDTRHGSFPVITNDEILYYRTVYLFGAGGTPHKGDPVDLTDPSTLKSLPIAFSDLPSGGKIEVRIALYVRQKGSSPDDLNSFCAATGTTNLTDNTVDKLPDIYLTENRRPIQGNTEYAHVMKTVLDAGGAHAWLRTSEAPIYIQPSGNQEPGSLGALRNITVRQETLTQNGYLGYAWQSYSSGVSDCLSGSPAQVDLAANLNTSTLDGGRDAQNGYARLECGLSGGSEGVSVAYSLLSTDARNFYVDTNSNTVRQVRLDQPAFADPSSGKSLAFAKLNFDSDKIVLHPSGHFISINNAFSKCEAHHLPSAPLSDQEAAERLLAYPFSGQGSRPGLMTSPVSLAASIDGNVLILEDSAFNNRIQAMDLGGNPLPLFSKQKTPYFLILTDTEGYVYLDIAVEFSGFIYVLSRNQNASEFRVDIYHPDQDGTSPISTTRGIHAAKLAVDYWRGLYTLNYEVLLLPDGKVPKVTEPSVSYWYPQQKSQTGLQKNLSK